jgi:hypothetical protein
VIRILDTSDGRAILNNDIDFSPDDLEKIYVIHRLSENMHIIGIKNIIFDGEELYGTTDEHWTNHSGAVDASFMIAADKDIWYDRLVCCIEDKVLRIGQFYTSGNLLIIDEIKGKEIKAVIIGRRTINDLNQHYYRSLIRVNDNKTLYRSEICREWQCSAEDKREKIVPNVILTKLGAVILPVEETKAAVTLTGGWPPIDIIGEIVVYNLSGEAVYNGRAHVIIEEGRLFHIEHKHPGQTEEAVTVFKWDNYGPYENLYDENGLSRKTSYDIRLIEGRLIKTGALAFKPATQAVRNYNREQTYMHEAFILSAFKKAESGYGGRVVVKGETSVYFPDTIPGSVIYHRQWGRVAYDGEPSYENLAYEIRKDAEAICSKTNTKSLKKEKYAADEILIDYGDFVINHTRVSK